MTSRTSKSAAQETEPRVALAKAIDNLAQKEEAFMKATEKLETFSSQAMRDLDIQLDAKKEELSKVQYELELAREQLEVKVKQKEEALNAKLEQKEEDACIKLEHKILKRKRDAVTEFLNESGEVPCKKSRIKKLESRIESLSKSLETSTSEVRAEEKQKANEHLEAELMKQALKTEAINAQFKAQYDQKDREIAMLNDTIANLRKEIENQRDLTKSVAQAGAFRERSNASKANEK